MVAALLLNAGADPNASRSTDGATALISAAESGHARCVDAGNGTFV